MELTTSCGGEDVRVQIPDKNLLAFLEPLAIPGLEGVDGAIREALENPIGSPRLSEIAKPSGKVAPCSRSAGSSPAASKEHVTTRAHLWAF